MDDCCPRPEYDGVFDDRFARRIARRYRRKGLNRTQRSLIGFLAERGLAGATVLEIGGGLGEMQPELLRLGAQGVVNLEISESYEEQAARLLAEAGVADRVERRIVDIAVAPETVEPADVVILHRVVCCYGDYEGLLGAAASHARRLLVYSHPPVTALTRALFAVDNVIRRIRRREFRPFLHRPAAMVAAASRDGLTPTFHQPGRIWQVQGLERQPG